MEEKRWKGTPECPFCKAIKKQYPTKRNGVDGYFECGECKKVYTVRTKTIFERSHVPLHKWLCTFYFVVTSRKGISSLQLSKQIGVTQKTAWFMLQRIREACKIDDNDDDSNNFLSGIIEADETYIGGKEANKSNSERRAWGRGTIGKTPILGMRERGGKTIALVVKDTKKSTIQAILNKNIKEGSILCTDEYRSYKGTKFEHKSVNHSAKQFVDGMAHTNEIESVWAVLKRGFYGIYHSFSAKHLQRYVDEFMYRLNEGDVNIHVWDRLDSLIAKAFTRRIEYRDLIA